MLAREIGVRQLERLSLIRVQPTRILDLGCGPGTHAPALAERYPDAQLVALDVSRQMLLQLERTSYLPGDRGTYDRTLGRAVARARRWLSGQDRRESRRITPVNADFERLPFAPGSFDFIWSNFALTHANDLPSALKDLATATRTAGVVMLTVPGPDTLSELRRALTQLGLRDSTHPFPDMHDVGDMLIEAGFADPVVDTERITLEYSTPQVLWKDARALGAVTAREDRQRGLMTPRTLRKIEGALRITAKPPASDGGAADADRITMTIEVVYAHAWKAAPRTTRDGRAIIRLERDAVHGSDNSPRSSTHNT